MMTRDELRNHVDTIVVIMMENRSFDHVLGHLRHADFGGRIDIDGIANLGDQTYRNPNLDNQGISPFWMPDAPMQSDLPHDPESVQMQLAHSSVTGSYLMNGFVRAFETKFHTSVQRPSVLGLLRPNDVPATGVLAKYYTVCDRWFACLPTSTAPNRLMSMCGETKLSDTGTLLPDQPTVYDWLLAKPQVRWRVYAPGIPFFTLMPRLFPLTLTSHFRRLTRLKRDLANEAPNEWPQVIFIEPEYYDCPIHSREPCDNHPPLAMRPGERFLREAYTTLAGNKARWSRTLFVLTYDEHGGFYDHVSPLDVKYRNPAGNVSFDSTGPRIPAIVAGPFAPRGVSHVQLDNTSILQLLAERFGEPGEVYSPAVEGRRQQGIASLSQVLDVGANDARERPMPVIRAKKAKPPLVHSQLQAAFSAAGRGLLSQHRTEALKKYPELKGLL
ncbi:MAG TPA: alkaline phosphatase family protein [Candidatus Binatia bacterium]